MSFKFRLRLITIAALIFTTLQSCKAKEKQFNIIGVKFKNPVNFYISEEITYFSSSSFANLSEDNVPREILDIQYDGKNTWYYVKTKDSRTHKTITGWTRELYYFIEDYDESLLFTCLDDFVKQAPYTKELLNPKGGNSFYENIPKINEFLCKFIEKASKAGLSEEYILDLVHNLSKDEVMEAKDIAELENPFYLMLAKYDLIEGYFDAQYFNLEYDSRDLCYGKEKETLLIAAVKNNAVRSVKYLINDGCDREISDIHGKTARDYALESKSEEIKYIAGTSANKDDYEKVINELIEDKNYLSYKNEYDEYYKNFIKNSESSKTKDLYRVSSFENWRAYAFEDTVIYDADKKEIPVKRGEELKCCFVFDDDYEQPGILSENGKFYIKYYIVEKEDGRRGVISDLYLAHGKSGLGFLISFYEKINKSNNNDKYYRRLNISENGGTDLNLKELQNYVNNFGYTHLVIDSKTFPVIQLENNFYGIDGHDLYKIISFDFGSSKSDNTGWHTMISSKDRRDSIYTIHVKYGEYDNSYLECNCYRLKIKEGTDNIIVPANEIRNVKIPGDFNY